MTSNENEFENDPLEGDFDHVGDFDEFDSSQKKTSFAEVWKSSPVIKIGMIAAAILVVVAVVSLFGGNKTSVPGSSVGEAVNDLKQAPGTTEVTPEMRDALEEHNQQRLEEALKQGASNIPTPIDPPKTLLGVPQSVRPDEDPLMRWKRMQEERLKLQREQEQYSAQAQGDPTKADRINALKSAMLAQFQDVVAKNNTIPQIKNVKVTDPKALATEMAAGSSASLAAGSVAQGQTTQTVEQTPLKVIIPAGQIVYSQLLVEANSDVPGPIVGMIASGPFSGSRVLGSFQKKEEYLTMRFSTLVGKDGNSISISAVAVDPETTLTGLATDVDHRYLQRVILPAAAQFIESIGQAYADQGTTSVTVNSATGESTTTQTNDINFKQEFAQATSDAAGKAGEIIDEGGDVEILVRVRAGTPFGLLFTSPVTEQQVKASKYATTETQSAQQQQQGVGLNQNLTPLQMLQQGLGSQTFLQQGANPYYSGTAGQTTAYPEDSSIAGPQVKYTDGLQ